MSGVVEIVDTTTRDGNQSLWSATGLTTADIVARNGVIHLIDAVIRPTDK